MTTMITSTDREQDLIKLYLSIMESFELPQDIFKFIEEDLASFPHDVSILEPCNEYEVDESLSPSGIPYAKAMICDIPNDEEELSKLMVDPATGLKVIDENPDYHPSMDHDYFITNKENIEAVPNRSKALHEQVVNNPNEPEVDVWNDDDEASTSGSKTRSSERIRDMAKKAIEDSRTAQAKSFSLVVHGILKENVQESRKLVNRRKPKNSVETTPYQSDMEESCSQSARLSLPKVTKKKSSKVRQDHSESERQRREILRQHFHHLSQLIPMDFLRGEKASSQISKQKILNGAKCLIVTLLKKKDSYKDLFHDYRHKKHLLQKYKLFNGIRR